ncbi:MAG: hypothetical protein H6729_06155 [Deltaproteobacteria bacterium]|nr:hypothetical protein [Deltaproteobacteria bacterium]
MARDRAGAFAAASALRVDLALPAFTLIRGGDLFERGGRPRRRRWATDPSLLETFRTEQLRTVDNGVDQATIDLAVTGLLRVVAGNAALCRRMLLAKPIRVVLIPRGRDFRLFGFPRHTNPHSAGIFWNRPADPEALLGLREEYVEPKPWLMVHEMTHAVHFLGLTQDERADIEKLLMPVYRSRMWVEEAVAIYAERVFGARYTEEDMNAPGLYGKTRRDWDPQHVFSLFMRMLLMPT